MREIFFNDQSSLEPNLVFPDYTALMLDHCCRFNKTSEIDDYEGHTLNVGFLRNPLVTSGFYISVASIFPLSS